MAQVIISMSEYEEYMELKRTKEREKIPQNWRFNRDNTLMDDVPF